MCDHEWKPFTTTTSLTLKYKNLQFCDKCKVFGAPDTDGNIHRVYS
jgi:hypothetical protein